MVFLIFLIIIGGHEYQCMFFCGTTDKKAFGAHYDLDYLYHLKLKSNVIKYLTEDDYTAIKKLQNIDEINDKNFNDILKFTFKHFGVNIINCRINFSNSYITKYYMLLDNINELDLIENKTDYEDSIDYINKYEYYISPSTIDILSKFMSNADQNISKSDYVKLEKFKSDENITLYRGMCWNIENLYKLNNFSKYPFNLHDIIDIKFNRATSWSTNRLIATGFANESDYWIVLKRTFKPSEIICDTRLFDKETIKKLYHAYQKEVIIKPDVYNCEIYKIGYKNDELQLGFDVDLNNINKIFKSFKNFCTKFIANNQNYKKLSYETKNKAIFGDYAVESPLLMIKSYGKSYGTVEYNINDLMIELNNFSKDYSSIKFESLSDMIKYMDDYSELEEKIIESFL